MFTVNRDIPMGHISGSLSKRLDKGIPDSIPTDNSAAERYHVGPGSEGDAEIIGKGLGAFCEEAVPGRQGYIPHGRKHVDGNGILIAAVICGFDQDDTAGMEGIRVEERYRGQGIGTRRFGEVEREAKEKGTCVFLPSCRGWVSGFFFQNGFTLGGGPEDYPKGHTACEPERRIGHESPVYKSAF